MNADLASLVADYLAARAARDKLDTDIRYLEDELRQRVAPGEKAELPDGHGVKVQQPSRRFDPELALQVLSKDQLAGLYEQPQLSSALAREYLPPALYRQVTRPTGQPSVRLL